MIKPKELKELYERGENVSAFLRNEKKLEHNSSEIIELAYDLQAGSYIASMNNLEQGEFKQRYSKEIANVINEFGKIASILEAGVGEATTLSGVLRNLDSNVASFGFDLSWSRAAYAKRWLESQGIIDTTVFTGNLSDIPLADNCIDVVYTSHSIEPNGGSERSILKELYRVAKKYIVLLEPGYEFASEEAKKRMEAHGYCKNIGNIASSFGYEILKHELFTLSANPLNPTAITVIRKSGDASTPTYTLACPKYKTTLEQIENMLFSPEALIVYPIVGGIPCLRIENGILASKFREIMLQSTVVSRGNA